MGFITAQPRDEESIMQCLYDHLDCCSLVIDDKLTIHAAIEQCLSMDIIQQMLICYPACCSRKNYRDNLLLHDLLCDDRHMISSDMLFLIVEVNVEEVNLPGAYSMLPLHCFNRCRGNVIVKLMQLCPDAIKATSRQILPLHYALINRRVCSTDAVMYVIHAYPDAGSVHDHDSSLPLLIECKNHCRYDVIMKLLEIYPDAISIVDKQGGYPLHYALANKHGTSEVIFYLVSESPATVHSKGRYGELPLHLECCYHCRYDIIIKLHIYPDAIKVPFNEHRNELPLHLILLSKKLPPSIRALQLLLHRYPDAMMAADPDDWLPVYRLCDMYFDQYISPYASYSSKLSTQYKAASYQ